ncbi:MAG: uroporphyrinogen-III synthase [Prevotellaceae bacterium]|jgi:uroporphyrinogen-III synthase|nr:uroporphyrinogen-III synthase [Prevotellaceae bacterium]
MNVTNILIAQPEPVGTTPYAELIEKHKLIIDFVPFTRIEGLSAKEFRAQRIDILEHTAVVFTARTAVDMFFALCEELRISVPQTQALKYFCITESIANYLQKYIIYRKRKVFFGNGTIHSLIDVIATKHRHELFLLALADNYKPEIPKAFDKARLKNTKSVFYRTVTNTELKNIELRRYDMLVFYSPHEVKSLLENFPNFKQGKTLMASFGAAAAKALKENNFKVSVEAPTPQAPSIAKALDLFLS